MNASVAHSKNIDFAIWACRRVLELGGTMSATGNSYPQGQRLTPVLWRPNRLAYWIGGRCTQKLIGSLATSISYSLAAWRSLVVRAACIIAVMSAFGLLGEPSAFAADLSELQSVTRIATAGSGEPEAFAFRPGLPARETDIDADLKLLLAQNGSPLKTGAEFGDDTILVAFALSVPQSIDEDIAKEHGLELVDRTELPSLGLRVVRYRAQANAPIAPTIANLRKDHRISSAQTSAEYRLPSQSGPATEVGQQKDRLGVARQAKRADPPRGLDGKAAAVIRVAPKFAGQPSINDPAVTPNGRRLDKGERPLASVGQMALRFPSADEPFVNVGVANRQRHSKEVER